MIKLVKSKVLVMEKKTNTFNYFIVVLIILVVAFLRVTYAYWNVTINQTNKNAVKSVCLKVSMAKDENEISLPKAMPISDEDGLALAPYTFSIKNTCNDNASYQINLESLSNINGTEEIPEDDRLAPKYVRFKLNETTKPEDGTMLLLSNAPNVNPILKNTYESHKLMTGYLSPSETKEFELRLWLDKDADEGAILKTFASKVTITNAYLEEDKIPPTANLDLAVCEKTITATGSGQASSGKTISKYEYKLDGDDWDETTSNEPKTFTVEDYGLHKISLRVTDNTNNVSGEVIKEVEIKEPETINIKGVEIPIATCGDGLYRVEHNEAGVDENWKGTEYRYAGVNYKDNNTSYVHNYVNFNDEKWRIIGLVNVKTEDGKYEQRLKIVRTDGVSDQKDFGSYYWNNTSNNDWVQSSLKNMLNSSYYNSESGNCYTTSSTPEQCDFESGSELPKGLNETAQGMVDDGVTWNLGGTADYKTFSNGLVTNWYNYERETTVPSSHQTEWTKVNDQTNHKGVGLIYPSDYGYASHGGNQGRDFCFAKELYNWAQNDYKTNCANKDWLKPSSLMWTIAPFSGFFGYAFYVNSSGYVSNNGGYVNTSSVVWPVVYLKSNIQISDGEGTFENPYNLADSVS